MLLSDSTTTPLNKWQILSLPATSRYRYEPMIPQMQESFKASEQIFLDDKFTLYKLLLLWKHQYITFFYINRLIILGKFYKSFSMNNFGVLSFRKFLSKCSLMISKTVDNRYHFSIIYVLDTYRWEIPNYYYMKNMSLKFLGSGYISKGYIYTFVVSVGESETHFLSQSLKLNIIHSRFDLNLQTAWSNWLVYKFSFSSFTAFYYSLVKL